MTDSTKPHQQGVAFPKGSVITFLQMGNHELISGCQGLYQSGFSYTAQQTTYAVWQSESWRIVSLDTGRLCYSLGPDNIRNVETGSTFAPMPDEVVEWLTNTVKLGDPSDKRGIILLSHHQPYDAFAKASIGAAQQINTILPKGKQILWFYGHDHMFTIFKKRQPKCRLQRLCEDGHHRQQGRHLLYHRIVHKQRLHARVLGHRRDDHRLRDL
mmetsp:Transcript_87207/g.281695  ORF Transcript_87207/g.281695 Transcript_87207/m.281695 type:complete len:213 (-) Transcript_87207:206-844(-)